MLKSIALSIVVLGIVAFTSCAASAALSDFLAGSYTDPANGVVTPYRLYVPVGYDPNKQYPLTLYMHGLGNIGTDNTRQVGETGTLLSWLKKPQYESFLLAPQTSGTWINSNPTIAIIENLISQYSIDRSRLYATGASLGGSGAFTHVQQQPSYFAAAVPVCGASVVNKAYLMVNQNLWSFHGSADTTVPPDTDRDTIAAVNALGGHAIYTEYAGAGHGIAGTVYSTQAMYDWMFAQRGEGTITDVLPERSGPLLKYDKQDLGNGLTSYTFWIYNEDTWQLPYTVNAAFRGVNGATIHQMGYYGEMAVDTEADANSFNGRGIPAYDKTQDTWAMGDWQSIPGGNLFDGHQFNGVEEQDNMFSLALYSGANSKLWTNVKVAHIVATGDVEWSTSILRYDTYYNTTGVTPEPASLALLALCGSMLLRVRRK